MSDEPRTIFVISDATGETAEKVVRAALLQFGGEVVHIRMYTQVRLEKEMRHIVQRAQERHALVVFTVGQYHARLAGCDHIEPAH